MSPTAFFPTINHETPLTLLVFSRNWKVKDEWHTLTVSLTATEIWPLLRGGVSFLYRFSAVNGALIPQPDKYDAGHAQGYEGSFLGLWCFPLEPTVSLDCSRHLEKMLHFLFVHCYLNNHWGSVPLLWRSTLSFSQLCDLSFVIYELLQI